MKQARKSLLASAVVVALLAGSTALAAEQDGTAAPGGDTVQQARTLDMIQVTGSRIARPDLVNPMPVSVIDVEDGLRFGDNSLYDILSSNPAVGVGLNLSSHSTTWGATNWDVGASFINLRNLGTNRSLTLIDGRRRVSSSARSSAVDISAIPLGMVDRVEIVTGGAAAVYGADAVTGAVNIITKREIDDTTVSVTRGLSDRGDAGKTLASFASGFNFADDRGRTVLGGTWSQTDALNRSDRYDWGYNLSYQANLDNTGVGDGIPDRILVSNFRRHYYAYEPSFWVAKEKKRYIMDGGAARLAVCDQYLNKAPSITAGCNGGDGRNLSDQDPINGAEEAFSFMARTEFDISDRLQWVGYANYALSNYDGLDLPWREDYRTIFMDVGGAKAYLDNPYLPDSVREIMERNNLTEVQIDRTYGNFPTREEERRRTTLTFGMELNGDITDYIGWSAFYQYGKVKDKWLQSNVPWKSTWLAARDVVTGPNGQPVCRDAVARANGCIPLNIFSMAAPSQQLMDYVLGERRALRSNAQHLFGAEVSGAAFDLPAGHVNFAAGLEYRKDTLSNRDDDPEVLANVIYGGGGLVPLSELDVESTVKEVFAELNVPLLSDAAFAKRLDLETAYRYSDYSTVGSTGTWKAGLIWEPVAGLAFRGVKSRSVRTPNFGELYEPVYVNTGKGAVTDPCQEEYYLANPRRAANCAALGVKLPMPRIYTGPNIATGGNPDLEPETSDSLTVGVVWRPSNDFDISLDYWDIEIKDVIAEFGYSTILSLCVDLPSIDNPFCGMHTRNKDDQVVNPIVGELLPIGALESISTQQMNASRMYQRGVDLGARWSFDLAGGHLGFTLGASYLLEFVTETTPGIKEGDVVRRGGYLNPKLRANLNTRYDKGAWSLALKTRFHGQALYDVESISDEDYPDNTIPSRTYHDISGRYAFGNGHVVNVGINNLFDVMPPQMPGVFVNNSVYGLVGRSYQLNWTYKF